MLTKKFELHEEGSLDKASLSVYILDTHEEIGIKKRPIVVICPGGGYRFVSEREGEMLALSYNAMGYHAAVVRYSIAPAVYPTALLELGRSILILKENAKEWGIDEDAIIVSGSSAGGHLAASYSMFWNKGLISSKLGVESKQLKVHGMILNYPVITSGVHAHRGSFENLLGDRYDELVDEMSLEKQVNEDTPIAFIWSTFADATVPVQNSLSLAEAMREKDIPCELHIYCKGEHGLSLANELTSYKKGQNIEPICETWISLARNWLYENFPLVVE